MLVAVYGSFVKKKKFLLTKSKVVNSTSPNIFFNWTMKSKHLRTTDLDDLFPFRPNVMLGSFCDEMTYLVNLLKLSFQLRCFTKTFSILHQSD